MKINFKERKTRVISVVAGIILLLILTNPSMTRFKEFVPCQITKQTINQRNLKCSRIQNWLLFSIYTFSYDEYGEYPPKYQSTYIGIFNNFQEIGGGQDQKIDKPQDSGSMSDTSAFSN